MNKFSYTSYAQEIIFGAGSVTRLGDAVEHFHMRRLMLCTTGSLRRGGHIKLVEEALGSRLVAVFEHVQPHVPDFQVAEALALASEKEIDAQITPKLVMYDPLLTLHLPPEITASTGINALAHCIEALYSITRNPLSTAAALSGVRYIVSALPRCYSVGDDREARTEMLLGSFLAGTALSNVAMGLHHGLCHVLGGTAGVPHGIANSIVLPHAMRFNLDATAPQLARAAEAMGISLTERSPEAAAEEAVQRVHDLIAQMNLPQHLQEVGVQETELPHLAQLAFQSRTVQSNPKPITNAAQIEEVLRAAW